MSERNILIAVNGGKSSDLAFNSDNKAVDVKKILKDENDRVETMMSGYMAQLKKAQVRGLVMKEAGGKPGEMIVKAVECEKADVIITGSCGPELGSASSYVAQNTSPPCAVTVVRDSS